MDSTTPAGKQSGPRAWALAALALLLPAALVAGPTVAGPVPARHAVSIRAALHTGPAHNYRVRALADIAVDGVWGPATTRALQWALWFNRPDGILGPATIKALQRTWA